jgi:hypothetical protein
MNSCCSEFQANLEKNCGICNQPALGLLDVKGGPGVGKRTDKKRQGASLALITFYAPTLRKQRLSASCHYPHTAVATEPGRGERAKRYPDFLFYFFADLLLTTGPGDNITFIWEQNGRLAFNGYK